MIRALVIFAVAIAVIAQVRAQDGDGDSTQCGFMTCSSSQCCVRNAFCMNIPGENGMCFMNGFGCPCEAGYECSRSWGMMGTCKPVSSTSK